MIENPDAIVSKAEEFFNNKKNQNVVFGVGGVIMLVALAFLVYNYIIGNRNQEAQTEMFQAVYYYEADSLGKALNGDGNNYGFLDIIDIYSGTNASNLSMFYAGSVYMKLGDYESAIRYLNDFSSSDILLQARAYSLVGDAYVELDDLENGIVNFKKAAEYKPNEQFTPGYLSKLALAYEQNGQLNDALSTYNIILDDYKSSSLYQSAQKQKARLEGMMAE